jgi:RNA polymerase sigma-70 factor (ECF subfamily)
VTAADLPDRAAFEALFRAHYAGLLRFAIRFVRTPAEAEELVQDVMLQIWIHRDRVAVGEELKTYLYRAVRNHALNALRRRKVEHGFRSTLPPEPVAPPTGSDESLTETERAVAAAIAALPERCREIFLMSREQGLSYTQIASVLGLSVKTVETQMGRALKSLRIALAEYR